MIKLTFEIGGREVDPAHLDDVLEQAVLASIEEQVRTKLDGIRDPGTGEFPVVAIRGKSLESISFEVSGSPELLAMVTERLGTAAVSTEDTAMLNQFENMPCVFLCHASDDKELARRIAHDFQRQGIATFFDEWEIGPGDSLRQKIDAGLDRCTHFVALLTPQSLLKPWVNAEIDAGFVQKVDGLCKFIPLRSGVSVEALSPLLTTLHSPELKDYDTDILSIVYSIHGVTRKPPLGPAPAPIAARTKSDHGLSPAAELVAKLMVEQSKHGDSYDPQLDGEELRTATGLPDDDLIDAIDELEGRGFIQKHITLGCGSLGFSSIGSEAALFVALDKYYKDWDPAADALRVAAELVNGDDNAGRVYELGKKLGWEPRRLNPAINYLLERDLIDASETMGSHPWCCHWISKTNRTRRFVRDRS